LRYGRRHGVQVRRIALIHLQFNIPADIAIVRVDLPFVLQQTLQIMTLAPTGYIIPGILKLSVLNNQEF